MSLAFDEYGRPFIIIRDQGQKQRLKGIEAQKVRHVDETLSTGIPIIRFMFKNKEMCVM